MTHLTSEIITFLPLAPHFSFLKLVLLFERASLSEHQKFHSIPSGQSVKKQNKRLYRWESSQEESSRSQGIKSCHRTSSGRNRVKTPPQRAMASLLWRYT